MVCCKEITSFEGNGLHGLIFGVHRLSVARNQILQSITCLGMAADMNFFGNDQLFVQDTIVVGRDEFIDAINFSCTLCAKQGFQDDADRRLASSFFRM